MSSNIVNDDIREIVKVTMNMDKKTLEDVQEISKMTHVTNRSNIVIRALKLYKLLLEMQNNNEKIFTIDKDGTKTKIEIVT